MQVFAGVVLAVVAWVGVATAQTPAQLTPTESITYSGTITEINAPTRIITTRDPDGSVATWEVPPSVPQAQIDSLRVGDMLTVTYSDAISIRRKPAGEPEVDIVDPATRIRTATVTVTALDLNARTVTFTGSRGRQHPRRVVNQANLDLLRSLAVGERVDITWSETMQFVTGPVDDWMNHRSTVAVQVGLDNQFTGHLIKQASGQTLGGVPINLNETSYDDVYGRIAFFKFGYAYRTSPRAEAVFNFVLSQSSSETVPLGTVGTANVPVSVNFDEFSYWGVEGGQRFFFTRVRFTPFVGYLIGANRLGDIRAEFVNVPPNLLPGYAAQDQKIFEKSWAFSAGPTGGLLVGLGPIEFIGEVQFRFMGGLSDVDWLVEEGLRDINTESERWSIPVLIGARVRF
jgi:hypothetical protein